ncbi:hypothetical protein F4780DRAFT_737149 [Xylariomycetidae sp. FL0641]|nr:hypothetical protein F4780DRAFT_737149 [Xylariomycetidae sp. FL0641]
MGVMREALSSLSSLRQPRFAADSVAYQELPSHDRSYNASPIAGSPVMSSSLRHRHMSYRQRIASLLRTSPKRMILLAFACSFCFILLVAGSLKAGRHYTKSSEGEGIPYHWGAFPRLNNYYNGVRSLVNYTDWIPEQKMSADAEVEFHDDVPLDPQVANPYPDYASSEYLKDHYPVEQCYVDEDEKYPAPDVFAYPGIPGGMPTPYWGAYENLYMDPSRCFERFGRFGPYGYSYSPAEGGLGLSNHSARAGVAKLEGMFDKVDYRGINWGKAQKTCYEKNKKRFQSENSDRKDSVKRTAFVLRTWTGYQYTDIQKLSIRAMINELSLKSGGEYDVHLLVHVKDDKIPIWASEEAYNETLRENVPEEFWDIATLWSEQLMRTYYPGPFRKEDNVANMAGADIYGVYRTAHFALQWFAQQHQEYDFFWNWEMDIRYSGHYYEFLEGLSHWAADQPRKFLWERSARFWIPDFHGSWPKFSRHVEKEVMESGEEPIWGPTKFDTGKYEMLPPPNATKPPRKFADDDYEWGVDEDADLITFDPLFDVSKTNWVFRDDVTGYDTSKPTPPRRAAIITVSRLSRRLLNTAHEETWRMHHTMFPEMWPPSVALHHGYKAVYAPHPVYFDREWPLDVMDQIFNHPKTTVDSPFGWGEHNMQGSSFYYNAGFSGALWRRWLGAAENGDGGRPFEEKNSGRMCLRGMLHHPIKHESIE